MDIMEGQGEEEEEEVYGEDEEFMYECHGSAEENAFDQAIGLIEETLMGALSVCVCVCVFVCVYT